MSEYYADRVLIGVAENEAEVHAIFDDREGRIQRVRCAYCGRQAHTTRQAAVLWFTEHECAETHGDTCACVLGEAA